MKSLVRNISINSLAIYFLASLVAGVRIGGGLETILWAGTVLTILLFAVKPILSFFTFPINFFTFGLFSIVINTFILYLLTVFVPSITITAFIFNGYSFYGFEIPKIFFNSFFAYVLSSIVVSTIINAIEWMID